MLGGGLLGLYFHKKTTLPSLLSIASTISCLYSLGLAAFYNNLGSQIERKLQSRVQLAQLKCKYY